MRKFFCISAGLAACSIAGLATAGGPQLQSINNGIEVTPIRFAGIDHNNKLTTPWFYTKDLQGTDSTCGDDLIYDAFDYNTPDGGPENGELCISSGAPSSRWFFGPSYCNTWSIHGMTQHTADTDGLSDHAKFAWFWYGDGNSNGSEQCFLVTFTYDDFDETCNGPAASNGFSGIILDFGLLGTNTGGYYFTNVNTLCSAGLGYTMPADGTGAYDVQQWNFFDGTNFTFATCGQPMLWGQRDTTLQGSTTGIGWDDDTDVDANGNCTSDINGNCLNTPDGIVQAPFECYTYSFGLCPDPLTSMVAFLGNAAPSTCLTLDVDQLIAGFKSTFTLANGTPGQVGAIVYGLKAGSQNVNGTFGYCATFGMKGISQDTLIVQKAFDGSGVISKVLPIPANSIGQRVFFQGAQRDTCPDECVSNNLDLTVQ